MLYFTLLFLLLVNDGGAKKHSGLREDDGWYGEIDLAMRRSSAVVSWKVEERNTPPQIHCLRVLFIIMINFHASFSKADLK